MTPARARRLCPRIRPDYENVDRFSRDSPLVRPSSAARCSGASRRPRSPRARRRGGRHVMRRMTGSIRFPARTDSSSTPRAPRPGQRAALRQQLLRRQSGGLRSRQRRRRRRHRACGTTPRRSPTPTRCGRSTAWRSATPPGASTIRRRRRGRTSTSTTRATTGGAAEQRRDDRRAHRARRALRRLPDGDAPVCGRDCRGAEARGRGRLQGARRRTWFATRTWCRRASWR